MKKNCCQNNLQVEYREFIKFLHLLTHLLLHHLTITIFGNGYGTMINTLYLTTNYFTE